MNINNLSEGMTIKNYKELCKVLEIEFKKSENSRKSQLKELARYTQYHKNGQSFIIDEVYEEVKDKVDNRGGNNKTPYIQYIEKLILDLLVQSYYKESVCLSKTKLLKELKMINDNYSFCKIRIPKLSKFIDIKQDTIDEWYSSADSTLQGNIEKALNNLRNQSLIFWTNEISVCKIDANQNNDIYDIQKDIKIDEYDEAIAHYKINVPHVVNYREATDYEKKVIIYTEHDIEKKMGYTNQSDIVKDGLWNEFKKRVNSIILKELNIDYYYNSYKILFNQEHILQKYEEYVDDLLLSKEERAETQKLLNEAVMERLNNNANKRYDRAINKVENHQVTNNSKLNNRIDDRYLQDNRQLVNTLVNIDSPSIKNSIKKTKVDKKSPF